MNKILIFAFMFVMSETGLSFGGNSDTGEIIITRIAYGVEPAFFETSGTFYGKLGSLKPEDVACVSQVVAGVPNGRYVASAEADRFRHGEPRYMLISKVEDPSSKLSGLLVCAICPYPSGDGYVNMETKDDKWIQGERHYDVWHMDNGKWKVVLGVNISNGCKSSWFIGNESSYSDDLNQTVIVLEKFKEVNKMQEEQIDKMVRGNLIRKGLLKK
jgi:hypothetical protein